MFACDGRRVVRVLAIESSCDETAAAVVRKDGDRLVVESDVVHTQIARHAVFGGVVPEVASREHVASISPVVHEALRRAKLEFSDIDALAVTHGPGLIGSLFVGVLFAKGLAAALNKPLLGVNHLEGHLAACDLLDEPPARPHVALLVSGGHTALYVVGEQGHQQTLGQTIDDAAGEAFDKTAKMLGIAYPGGAELSRRARGGNADRFTLPVGLAQRDNLDFSFSGLKTAVSTLLQKTARDEATDADFCASIERVIVRALVTKAVAACERAGLDRLVLAGGVAANDLLRTECDVQMRKRGGRVFAPPKKWCTDNAAMIAAAALRVQRLALADADASEFASLQLPAKAYLPLVGQGSEGGL